MGTSMIKVAAAFRLGFNCNYFGCDVVDDALATLIDEVEVKYWQLLQRLLSEINSAYHRLEDPDVQADMERRINAEFEKKE